MLRLDHTQNQNLFLERFRVSVRCADVSLNNEWTQSLNSDGQPPRPITAPDSVSSRWLVEDRDCPDGCVSLSVFVLLLQQEIMWF